MPQLNTAMAEKVNAAEDGFKPLDPGIYVVQLHDDVEVKEGDKGPYWRWTFQIPADQPNAGRRFWTNTSLSEAAFFKLKEIFAAFGVSTATDTAELVGRKIRVQVKHSVVQKGARTGEITNEIEKCLPLDGPTGVDETAKAAAESAKKDDAPLF